jgi:hypothetical protein
MKTNRHNSRGGWLGLIATDEAINDGYIYQQRLGNKKL